MPLKEVINTRRFDFERASAAGGWMGNAAQGAPETVTPETLEYNIANFVYRCTRAHAWVCTGWGSQGRGRVSNQLPVRRRGRTFQVRW